MTGYELVWQEIQIDPKTGKVTHRYELWQPITPTDKELDSE